MAKEREEGFGVLTAPVWVLGGFVDFSEVVVLGLNETVSGSALDTQPSKPT